jgi:hypothetical protein
MKGSSANKECGCENQECRLGKMNYWNENKEYRRRKKERSSH